MAMGLENAIFSVGDVLAMGLDKGNFLRDNRRRKSSNILPRK